MDPKFKLPRVWESKAHAESSTWEGISAVLLEEPGRISTEAPLPATKENENELSSGMRKPAPGFTERAFAFQSEKEIGH